MFVVMAAKKTQRTPSIFLDLSRKKDNWKWNFPFDTGAARGYSAKLRLANRKGKLF